MARLPDTNQVQSGHGRIACSDDGSVLAVGTRDSDSMAVVFFSDGSSTPTGVFEDDANNYYPRQVRLTADGTKCLIWCNAVAYRVDVATATLEDTFSLTHHSDAFAISPDGSILVAGYLNADVYQWNGSDYVKFFTMWEWESTGGSGGIR